MLRTAHYLRSSERKLMAKAGQCRRGLGRSNSFHVHTVNPELLIKQSIPIITRVRNSSIMARAMKPKAKAMQSIISDAGKNAKPSFARHSASRRLLKSSISALPKLR